MTFDAILRILVVVVLPCTSLVHHIPRLRPRADANLVNLESRRDANLDSTPSPRRTSLSDLVSSPERYAAALNVTPEEVLATQTKRLEASLDLYETLRNGSLSGTQRHAYQCQHRLDNGRHPFVCAKCWSYLPVCVCSDFPKPFELPAGIELVVWVHHKEWGLSSNTGGLLALALQPCTLLMKGLPEHDAHMTALLSDPDVKPVLLWPARDRTDDIATSLSDLRQVRTTVSSENSRDYGESCRDSAPQPKRIVLIAVDATWSGAAKMVSKFPKSVARLGLSESELFWESEGVFKSCAENSRSSSEDDDAASRREGELLVESDASEQPRRQSLLAPLRKHSSGGSSDVCTAEAAVAALRGIGLGEDSCREILRVVKKKIDLTARYRGKITYIEN